MTIKTNVLGTEYKVSLSDLNNPDLADCSGKCFTELKEIVVRDPEYILFNSTDVEKQNVFKQVLLHELVHAYSKESGTHYDDDENLTDWVAQMIPKIIKSYNEVLSQLQELEAKSNG